VAGEFNGWAATLEAGGLAMQWKPELGRWFAALDLPGGNYAYKFVTDDNWRPNPNCAGPVDECAGRPECMDDNHGACNNQTNVEICAEELCDPPCGSCELCRDGACEAVPDCGGSCGDPTLFDWKDAVMYFVMVDRFHNSDGQVDPVPEASGGEAAWGPSGQYEGGDLSGLTSKLPYLEDLGISTIWVSAPYNNREYAGASMDPGNDPHLYSGYHGYWPSPLDVDYSDPAQPSPTPTVESRIGSSDDLHNLVDGAHGIGMMVLFDYVMNHVDLDSELYQAHNDWFYQEDGRFRLCGPENLWDDDFYGVRCAFTDYLPPFDFSNEAARAWSIDDAMWWAQEYNIDGYRLDAIKHVPLNWLTDLRARLNASYDNPNGGRFYLVGETFDYFNRDLLRRFVEPDTMLDGQFDFPFKKELCEAVFHDGGNLGNFSNWMDGNDGFYGANAIMTTWIGNHDIPRAIHFANREFGCTDGSNTGNGWTDRYNQPQAPEPYERLGVAFAVMMTNPGIPLIYYGDELGLAGGGDPDNRRMMPWADLNAHQSALRERLSKLGKIRAENKALSRGTRMKIHADQHTWVYRMGGCDGLKSITVAINKADGPNTVQIPGGEYLDLMNAEVPIQGGAHELPPRSFLILREP